MPEEHRECVSRREELREVLLGYLLAASCPAWPGADGLTVEEALLAYAQNAAAGRVPDREELLRRHADLRDAVRAFFADKDRPGQGLGC
jgi:hypothetical protein